MGNAEVQRGSEFLRLEIGRNRDRLDMLSWLLLRIYLWDGWMISGNWVIQKRKDKVAAILLCFAACDV
jgi:hypothetical protein